MQFSRMPQPETAEHDGRHLDVPKRFARARTNLFFMGDDLVWMPPTLWPPGEPSLRAGRLRPAVATPEGTGPVGGTVGLDERQEVLGTGRYLRRSAPRTGVRRATGGEPSWPSWPSTTGWSGRKYPSRRLPVVELPAMVGVPEPKTSLERRRVASRRRDGFRGTSAC